MATPSQTYAKLVANPTYKQVLEQYPSVAGLLGQPGVADMLLFGATAGWTPNELASHLETTQYWKNSTAESRQWDLLVATDPNTANTRWHVGLDHINQMSAKLGVHMSNQTYSSIIHSAITNAWSDDTLTAWLLGANKFDPKHLPNGDLGGSMTQVKNIASTYGMSVSPQTAVNQAVSLLNGKSDAAAMAEYYKNAAISVYGHNKGLVDALNRGVTVKDYADPYVQLAAQEVAADPASINLADPKWNKFLTTVDPKTGQGMSLDQWRATLRTDPTYGYNHTQGAADQAAQLADQLGKTFGVIGS